MARTPLPIPAVTGLDAQSLYGSRSSLYPTAARTVHPASGGARVHVRSDYGTRTMPWDHSRGTMTNGLPVLAGAVLEAHGASPESVELDGTGGGIGVRSLPGLAPVVLELTRLSAPNPATLGQRHRFKLTARELATGGTGETVERFPIGMVLHAQCSPAWLADTLSHRPELSAEVLAIGSIGSGTGRRAAVTVRSSAGLGSLHSFLAGAGITAVSR